MKIYVCNVMTQPGETDGMTRRRSRRGALPQRGRARLRLRRRQRRAAARLLEAYAEEGQVPVAPDVERIAALGARTRCARR